MSRPKGSFYALASIVVFFALALVLPWMRGSSPVDFGLDLSGGVAVTYRPDFSSRLDIYQDATEEELLALAKETLTSRLHRNLNTIPEVVIRGDQRIVVSIPEVEDQERILELFGETYHLTWRLVLEKHEREVEGRRLFAYQGRHLDLADPAFSGDMLDERYIRAEANRSSTSFDAAELAPKVAFRFQSPYDEAFAKFTGENVGRELAILIDDRVEWVGTIESAIDGSGVLAGSYSLDEAADVATMLRSGTLPISLEVESLTAVGPTLGQEIKDLGMEALLLSLLLLAALVVLAYGHRRALVLAGLFSLVCLLFLIAGMAAAFDLTLDMVGIAGIVLSIGMGMDAFILVFESLEARSGASAKVDGEGIARRTYSFSGEGRTLFHANATTLVVILLLLTTDRLKSFALFIFVGIFASILTIFITREVLRWSYGGHGAGGFDLFAWLRRFRPRAYRFRKPYFAALAAIFVLTGLVLVRGDGSSVLFGADFREGTQLVVSAGQEENLDSALSSLEEEFPDVPLRKQRLGEPEDGRYLLTLGVAVHPSIGGSQAGGGTLSADEISRILGEDSVKLESLSSIDSRVSSARLLKGLSVLLLSFFFLAVYFVICQGPIDRYFSPAAREELSASSRFLVFSGVLVAVVADVAVVFSSLVLFEIPISLPVVAAVLTIIGYSVNDSVVLWSHVRMRDPVGERLSASERVTRSVDRILSRAFLTSLSTLVPALTILFVGLGPLEDFARVMILGTVAGTLSSMFVVGSFAVRALELQRRSSSSGSTSGALAKTANSFSRLPRRARSFK